MGKWQNGWDKIKFRSGAGENPKYASTDERAK